MLNNIVILCRMLSFPTAKCLEKALGIQIHNGVNEPEKSVSVMNT